MSHSHLTSASLVSSASPVSISDGAMPAGATLVLLGIVCDASRAGGAPTLNGLAMAQAGTEEQSPGGGIFTELWYSLVPGASISISVPNTGGCNVITNYSVFAAPGGFESVYYDTNQFGDSCPPDPDIDVLTPADGLGFCVIGLDVGKDWTSVVDGTEGSSGDTGFWSAGTQYRVDTAEGGWASGWVGTSASDFSFVAASFDVNALGTVADLTTSIGDILTSMEAASAATIPQGSEPWADLTSTRRESDADLET